MFFLSLFGIVDGKFFLQVTSATLCWLSFWWQSIVCPTPEPIQHVPVRQSPMLGLYLFCIGVGVAFMVHPKRRKKEELKRRMTFVPSPATLHGHHFALGFLCLCLPHASQPHKTKPANSPSAGQATVSGTAHLRPHQSNIFAVAPKRFITARRGMTLRKISSSQHFAPEEKRTASFEVDRCFLPQRPPSACRSRCATYIVKYPQRQPSKKGRHHRPRRPLRDQLPPQGHRLRRSQRRSCTSALLIEIGEYPPHPSAHRLQHLARLLRRRRSRKILVRAGLHLRLPPPRSPLVPGRHPPRTSRPCSTPT